MSRQERKDRAAKKINLYKVSLAKFINSNQLLGKKKELLIRANPQEACLVNEAARLLTIA